MAGELGPSWPRPGWLIVAEIGRPHGVRGEVAARTAGVDVETLLALKGARLLGPGGRERDAGVLAARPGRPGRWILSLEGVGDRTQAADWNGAVVIAPRDSLPEPGADEWYVADLVGLEVWAESGERLGMLEEVLDLPANDVFVVRGPRGELLLPVTWEVLQAVDRDAGRVTVRLLPGLIEED